MRSWGFHAQQAVEKSLKAAPTSGDRLPYTHDLDGLNELCQKNGLELPSALEGVERLAPYGACADRIDLVASALLASRLAGR